MHTRTNKQPYPQNTDITQLPRRPFIITEGVCRGDTSLPEAGGVAARRQGVGYPLKDLAPPNYK